jgi:hypothetical protein
MRTQKKIIKLYEEGNRLIVREKREKRGEQTDRREESMVRKGRSKRKLFQRTV